MIPPQPRQQSLFGIAYWTLIALLALLTVGCLDQAQVPSSLPPTTTSTLQNSDTTIGDTRLNPVEGRLIDSLSKLGVQAQIAELSPDTSASLWASFTDGSELYVFAAPKGSLSSDVTIVSSRATEGVEIVVLTSGTNGIRVRFDCDPTTYELGGSPPPDFQGDLESFAVSLAKNLECIDQ